MIKTLKITRNRQRYPNGQSYWPEGGDLSIGVDYKPHILIDPRGNDLLKIDGFYRVTAANYLPYPVRLRVPQATQVVVDKSEFAIDRVTPPEIVLPAYAGGPSPAAMLLNCPVHVDFYIPQNRTLLKQFQDAILEYEILDSSANEIEQASYNSQGWNTITLPSPSGE